LTLTAGKRTQRTIAVAFHPWLSALTLALGLFSAGCSEVISVQTNAFEEGGHVVFDATTHELVGASYMGDTPSLECGATRVIGHRAGKLPPADCARGERKWLCRGDAGPG
jgi:hypothetical protein